MNVRGWEREQSQNADRKWEDGTYLFGCLLLGLSGLTALGAALSESSLMGRALGGLLSLVW